MVIEIRRARSDRNAAEFYGYPYFTFYLEEIFCAHLFPFFFFVISYYIEIHNNIANLLKSFFLNFCKYVALDVEDY